MNTKNESLEVKSTDYEICAETGDILYIEINTSSGNKWHVQVDGAKFNSSTGCLLHVNDAEYCYDELESEKDFVISCAESIAKDVILDKSIDDILSSENGENIEIASDAICKILGEEVTHKHLILSSVYFNAECIDIGSAMCQLQISLDCTQEQSSEIINLFGSK